LIAIDILLFVLLCFLIHRDVIASLWSSRDFHLPHRDMDIPEALLGRALIQGFGLGCSEHHSIPRYPKI
jgi:hypothetical protein